MSVNVGDSVVFKYGSSHDVYQMASETAYNNCDFTSASLVGSTTAGSGNGLSVTCSTAGDRYYACSTGSHCSSGQKLKVSVGVNSNGAQRAAAGFGFTMIAACILQVWISLV